MNSITKIFQTTLQKLVEANIEPNEAKIETTILVENLFSLTKKDILLNPLQEIPEDKQDKLNALVKKRIEEKIPVQYLVNKAYFMEEEFYVDENVLIPRPETEMLVEEILKLASKNTKIVDIGTGSGCIAIMLAQKLNQVTAVDISEKALNVAKFNAQKLGVETKIKFIESDIFENFDEKDEKFDIIVSNPPYIPAKERESLQIEVTRHEPHLALFVDDEAGITFYEKLAKQATAHLNPAGILAVEIGISQANAVKEILKNNSFNHIEIIKDFAGIERVIIGKFNQ